MTIPQPWPIAATVALSSMGRGKARAPPTVTTTPIPIQIAAAVPHVRIRRNCSGTTARSITGNKRYHPATHQAGGPATQA